MTLILPPTDILPVKALKPSRRGFMQVLAGAFTGAVAAPMILPFTSLDEINTLQNRMMIAFSSGTGSILTESGINIAAFISPDLMRKWRAWNNEVDYHLVRRAEITHFRSLETKKAILGRSLKAIERQDLVHGPDWVERDLRKVATRQIWLAKNRDWAANTRDFAQTNPLT